MLETLYYILLGIFIYLLKIWAVCMRKSQDSSVGILKGYRLDGQDLISGNGKIFLFSIVSRLDLGPPILLSNGDWGLFPWQ
jgi:hypothetical protein